MRGRNNKFVPYRAKVKMLGEIVTAMGCCGEGNGKEVIGELIKISPFAIVRVPQRVRNGKVYHQQYEVNPNTLELVTIEKLMN